MATRYWVGGSGTWDASDTTNWSASSGGAGGASVPTSADDVVFDSASNATDYTVTFGLDVVECKDWTVAGPASGNVTFDAGVSQGEDQIKIHGSLLFPASGMVRSFNGIVVFAATTTGHTITTNGVSLSQITFDGENGGWTLGSALTAVRNTQFSLQVFRGTLDTSAANNYSIITSGLNSGVQTQSFVGVRQINLNASTITLSNSTRAIGLVDDGNLTFNAGTSQINCTGTSPDFAGGGYVFHNVAFTATSGSRRMSGDNTFNNLSVTGRTTTGTAGLSFFGNQVINGTLTCTTNFAYRRMQFTSGTVGVQQTLKVNASSLTNVDFKDIAIDPTSTAFPLTGTRIGDRGGNSGITFTAAANKYFVNAAGGNIGAAVWALSSGGSVSANNFPLPQDTIVFDDASMNSGATVTFTPSFWFGSLDCSARTTPMTMSVTAITHYLQDVTLNADVTVAGSSSIRFDGYANTQTLTVNGATLGTALIQNGYNNTVVFADGFTSTSSVQATSGTLEFLAGATYTADSFSFSDTTIESSVPGTQFTLSQASGTVNATNTTITDSEATGGATWNAFVTNGNADGGNNTGWDFFVQLGKYIYTRRKNKRILP
jgi:hypothetical protein